VTADYRGGLDGWLAGRSDVLRRRARFGLVVHAASLNAGGEHSIERMSRVFGRRLRAIFAPEHGWLSSAPAGEHVPSSAHPDLGIPVHSLYGSRRRPAPEMLDGLDAVVFDLQDIGVRCYTYVSTLREVMTAAAAAGKTLVVADRPIPLARAVDGPMLDPARESFVGCIPAPLAYAMTPAETARWLRAELRLDLELRVAPMRGWTPGEWPAGRGAPPWVPPSPGIRTWDAARAYASTVFAEALPSIDCDRGGLLPFQVFGAAWLDARAALRRLARASLPGVRFHSHRYMSGGVAMHGVRMTIADAREFRPVRTGVALLRAAQDVHGPAALWNAPGVREAFFDQLAGSDRLREDLKAGRPTGRITAEWTRERRAFLDARDDALLYAR